jgi:tripartite-type tricarboxylate transporter receptor subunit TctC
MGQQLLVENITGAAGMIGAQRLARAAPDGYTIGGISDSTVTIQGGRLRALGIANEKRTPLLPAVPTIAEAGIAGFTFSTWTGLFAPRGTPKPIIERLNTEVTFALSDTASRTKMQSLGGNPQATTPAELVALIQRTTHQMMQVIQSSKISIE